MKKIDFHIHTIKTGVEADFTFCAEMLVKYVSHAKLDCIAITNHNIFDLVQFNAISQKLQIPVFPGIEIDVEKGQILLLGKLGTQDEFSLKSLELASICEGRSSWITVEQLSQIFGNLSEYIIIPHYDKNPAIKEDTLKKLEPFVTAGEVSSPKKFMYSINNSDRLVPVYFSDCRIKEQMTSFSSRQTYIDCGEVSFSTIRNCLRDKSKVSLSEEHGNKVFDVFDDGQKLSTGLNVIVGERSSGKSHTLKRMLSRFENPMHVEQFELVARNEEEDRKRFQDSLRKNQSLFSDDYLKELQLVIVDILDIDLEADNRNISNYLDSLLEFAKQEQLHDIYSKASLFSEEKFPDVSQSGLRDLIQSTKNLLRNEQYRGVIEKHLPLESLKSLYVELLNIACDQQEQLAKKKWVNELVVQIQRVLKTKTAAPTITEFNPYKFLINKVKIKKFDEIVKLARHERQIMSEEKGNFQLVAEAGTFSGAGDLKAFSRTNLAFKTAYESYNDPYMFLKALSDVGDKVTPAEYYKYFVKIDYRILNRDGFEVSGGERSEFFLLQELDKARAHDVLLIDEPESSFDNLFLKNQVNQIIKGLSSEMPVVLVTHNNTVGASIQPDYLLCTKKENIEGKIEWRIYSGFPTEKELKSTDGNTIKTWDTFMGCLEAGSDAYEERSRAYANLKD